MEFSHLLEKDRDIGAFQGYYSVSEAKISNIIPEEYHKVFEDRCECGSEWIISADLTQFMCCNPRCKIKIGYALSHMLKSFDIKYVGEATCLEIARYAYNKLEMKSHLELLNLPDSYISTEITGTAFMHFKQGIARIRESLLTFPEMISKLAIPSWDNTALKVFDGIKGVDQFIDIVASQEGKSLPEKLRFFLASRSVYDPMKLFYLNEFLEDINYAEHKVFRKIVQPGLVKFEIVPTGELYFKGTRITKDGFVRLCNEVGMITSTKRLFEVERNTKVETTSYFIADYESTSNKYLKAKEREALEGRKLLYTSEEFLQMLMDLKQQALKNMKVFNNGNSNNDNNSNGEGG